MTYSDADWQVYTASTSLAPLSWITGRVHPGDVHTVLEHLCERFNTRVEPINKAASWGWANRNVRGATTVSRHARALAVDLNAPDHGLGLRGTFTKAQVAEIHQILAELDDVVRWGGDYQNRADEMHFEINDSPAAVAKVAAKIKGDDMANADDVMTELKSTRRAIGLLLRAILKAQGVTDDKVDALLAELED